MALKSVVEDINDVDEAFRGEYVQRGDVFVLDITDFGKHPGAVTLKGTADKLDRKVKDLSTELATTKSRFEGLPEDFTVDAYNELLSKGGGADVEALKQQHTTAVDGLKAKHAQELVERDNKINALTSTIENGAINSTLRGALLEAGVEPDLLDGALATVLPMAKVQKSDNGEITGVVMDTDLGETAVTDFVRDWSAGKGKAYLGKPGGTGGDGNNRPGSPKNKGDFGGDRSSRVDAIAAKFPNLPAR